MRLDYFTAGAVGIGSGVELSNGEPKQAIINSIVTIVTLVLTRLLEKLFKKNGNPKT